MSRNLSRTDLSWWHRRYLQQAEWTRTARVHLYRRLEIARCGTILEIGCGTGVISNELVDRTDSAVFGLDNDFTALDFAREQASNKMLLWLAGDADKLPFADASLDLIVTHYFWLWAKRSDVIINECRRVLKESGRLAALAEPDYSSRQDHPEGRPNIKEFLMSDLKAKGADPAIGKKIEDIFARAGFKTVAGSVCDKTAYGANPELFRQEWKLLERLGYPSEELASIKKQPEEKWITMPIHWAIGRKK